MEGAFSLKKRFVSPLGAWGHADTPGASQAHGTLCRYRLAGDFAAGLVYTPQPSLCQTGVHTLPYAELAAKVSPWVRVSFSFLTFVAVGERWKGRRLRRARTLCLVQVCVHPAELRAVLGPCLMLCRKWALAPNLQGSCFGDPWAVAMCR